MRKITFEAKNNFWKGNNLNKQNRKVVHYPKHFRTVYLLHGNLIAKLDHERNVLRVSNGGWQSRLTCQDLNGILNGLAYVYIKKGQMYISYKGEETDFETPLEIQL